MAKEQDVQNVKAGWVGIKNVLKATQPLRLKQEFKPKVKEGPKVGLDQ